MQACQRAAASAQWHSSPSASTAKSVNRIEQAAAGWGARQGAYLGHEEGIAAVRLGVGVVHAVLGSGDGRALQGAGRGVEKVSARRK